MSIFPKRTKPGGNVTIHLGFGPNQLNQQHQFTFVEIVLKDPNNVRTSLYSGNVLSLPIANQQVDFDLPALKTSPGLRKNVPYLLIADYLGGNHQKEQVVQLLKRLHNGKHFYFTKTFDKQAPLGKYVIESTFYINGEPIQSKTVSDDYFFLEQPIIEKIESAENGFKAEIFNPSSEITPAIIVTCSKIANQYQYAHRSIDLLAGARTTCFFETKKAFLLYNEQREVIPLIEKDQIIYIRNQKVSSLNKIENNTEKLFVFGPGKNDAFELDGLYKRIWEHADGLTTKQQLIELGDTNTFNEMINNQLIYKVF